MGAKSKDGKNVFIPQTKTFRDNFKASIIVRKHTQIAEIKCSFSMPKEYNEIINVTYIVLHDFVFVLISRNLRM